MRKICDLDMELYRCVSPDIRTRAVIITGEQIAHILMKISEKKFRKYLRNKKILYKAE